MFKSLLPSGPVKTITLCSYQIWINFFFMQPDNIQSQCKAYSQNLIIFNLTEKVAHVTGLCRVVGGPSGGQSCCSATETREDLDDRAGGWAGPSGGTGANFQILHWFTAVYEFSFSNFSQGHCSQIPICMKISLAGWLCSGSSLPFPTWKTWNRESTAHCPFMCLHGMAKAGN